MGRALNTLSGLSRKLGLSLPKIRTIAFSNNPKGPLILAKSNNYNRSNIIAVHGITGAHNILIFIIGLDFSDS